MLALSLGPDLWMSDFVVRQNDLLAFSAKL